MEANRFLDGKRFPARAAIFATLVPLILLAACHLASPDPCREKAIVEAAHVPRDEATGRPERTYVAVDYSDEWDQVGPPMSLDGFKIWKVRPAMGKDWRTLTHPGATPATGEFYAIVRDEPAGLTGYWIQAEMVVFVTGLLDNGATEKASKRILVFRAYRPVRYIFQGWR